MERRIDRGRNQVKTNKYFTNRLIDLSKVTIHKINKQKIAGSPSFVWSSMSLQSTVTDRKFSTGRNRKKMSLIESLVWVSKLFHLSLDSI